MIKLKATLVLICSVLFVLTRLNSKAIDFGDLELSMDNGELVWLNQSASEPTKTITINGEEIKLSFENQKSAYTRPITNKGELLRIKSGNHFRVLHVSAKANNQVRLRRIPLYLSIVPPLLAIILALAFKEVLIALFVGIWSGAFIAGGLRWFSIKYWFLSIFEVVDKYIIQSLNDSGHLSVVVFSMLIGGMVAIISKNGGMEGIVKAFSRFANSSKNAQFTTYLLGIGIFFDDYANTLIVGNTMRPVTDRFRISREKLAYLVDSTAAPIAALAFITTWIGFELGQIDIGMSALENYPNQASPYAVFFQSLRYAFYPILTLIFIFMLIRMQKDFGPMHKVEVKTRQSGVITDQAMIDEDQSVEDLSPIKGAPKKWIDAALPVLTVILVTIYGLIYTGMTSLHSELLAQVPNLSESWSEIWRQIPLLNKGDDSFFLRVGTLIGQADSYVGLLWGSLAGVSVAIIISVGKKIMTLNQCMDTLVLGFKTMVPAILILTLAWGLAIVTEELETAHFLSGLIEGRINPYLVPTILFPLSAIIAFSTGSSWSTMAILYPIAIPATWTLCQSSGLDLHTSQELLYNVIAIVIGASVLGDHCSPISDTTILSSLASQCNHLQHVKTQMPYALTVGALALLCNTVSTMLGGGWLIFLGLLVVSVAILYGIIKYFGKPTPNFS